MLFRRYQVEAQPHRAAKRGVALAVGLLGLGVLAVLIYWIQRYVRRTIEMPVRQETHEQPPEHEPPSETEVPPEAQGGTPIQTREDGTGTLYHRRYSVTIADASMTAEALMAAMQADPNRFSPQLLARFEKTEGAEGRMAVGDEYFIHITGPWNGPVRVTAVSPTGFTFVTLEGHLEAGEIHFECKPHPERADALDFEIYSWARSRDKAVQFAYEVAGVAKTAQTSMWANWCRKVVEESGGALVGEIEIVTEECPIEEEEVTTDD